VISLVVITILNDGTIITIAYDKVIPDVRPQKWDLWEVVIISCVLMGVACISSIILLVASMQSRGEEFISKVWCVACACVGV
jgi:H+-transporting ATPase